MPGPLVGYNAGSFGNDRRDGVAGNGHQFLRPGVLHSKNWQVKQRSVDKGHLANVLFSPPQNRLQSSIRHLI